MLIHRTHWIDLQEMVRYNASKLFSACPSTDNPSAVFDAWNIPYVSDCHKILVDVITKIKSGKENDGPADFNNTVMIVQSSGTGKSRMVDEAARLVFTLPFNLRSEADSYLGNLCPKILSVMPYH